MTYKNKDINKNRLKLAIGVLIIATIMAYFGLKVPKTEYKFMSQQEKYEKFQKEQERIEKESPKLSEDEIKGIIIKDYILDCNPLLDESCAEQFTNRIIKNSKRDKYSAYMQTSLIGSESDFHPKVKHILASDRGMTGTNIKVWEKELKQAGIIKSVKDLENPIVSIDASSYIIKYYMTQYHGKTFHAIAGYKGYCKKGKENARIVVNEAMKLKRKEKEFRV